MKNYFLPLTAHLTIGAVLFLSVAGCASFAGKELPRYTYEQIVPNPQKPSIDYDAKFLTLGRENAAAVRMFQEQIEKVFRKSTLFERFDAGIGSAKFHFSMALQNEGNIVAAGVSGFISGLTLTLLPAYARDEYILTVDVKKGNQLLKQYRYKHYMDSWIELFLIFLTPTHFPPNVAREVIDDMLLNLLHDVQKDRILE